MILDGIAGIQFIFKENLFILQLFYRLIIHFVISDLYKKGVQIKTYYGTKVLFTNIMLKMARFC
jgi:hypothetical protein